MENTINKLNELANNLWWTWSPEAVSFWSQFGQEQWTPSGNNPARLLNNLTESEIETRLSELKDGLLEDVWESYQSYLAEKNTWHSREGKPLKGTIAYFSAEYGIHESLPNYSGGLGVLAGDHVKSASDLGLPFVAVGLLYRNGYVRQQIEGSGEQVAQFDTYKFEDLAVQPVFNDGTELIVSVPILEEECYAKVWSLAVGRVTLYYLDTDIPQNPDHLRSITSRLYGGGNDLRIKQEMVLGVGGVRALTALGIKPALFHLNEGHSSFLALERARMLVKSECIDVYEAFDRLRSSNAFTTHTPVEAGHDRFHPDLAYRHLCWWSKEVGIDGYQLLDLGRWPNNTDPESPFNMTLLAMRASHKINGVAGLHGEVSRQMFARYWPGVPVDEVPITHVTNGVHAPSWQHSDLHALLMSTAGADYRDRPSTDACWGAVDTVDEIALHKVHKKAKSSLLSFAVRRENKRRLRLGLDQFESKLSEDALTIGFARRFASYKRGDLIFTDLERLTGILDRAPGPVQFLFSGKAHPADSEGQKILQRVYEASQSSALKGRVLLIEDYDIEIGRALVQGVDVWLNNPRRPKEASGTSGMKVAMNGGLNLSILDGWWPEGFNGNNGWTIGDERTYNSPHEQDQADLESLYQKLEFEVIPAFFDRNAEGVSLAWSRMMKEAIKSCTRAFHSDRQVIDYVRHIYQAN
ncbi:MAG: alpha-glucan family phosphorylase [Bradymonadia bacterium]